MLALNSTALTASDIVSIIVGFAGAVVLVVLVILLINLLKTIKRVNKLLDEVNDPVKNLLDGASASVPGILEDVKTVSGGAAGIVSSASDLVENLTSGRKRKSKKAEAAKASDGAGIAIARLVGFTTGFISALKKSKKKKSK